MWIKDSPEDGFYLECDCQSREHIVFFSWDDDEDFGGLVVQTFMQKQPFWRRLVNSWGYLVLGHLSEYGHFESTIANPKKARELAEWISKKTVPLDTNGDE